MRTMIGLLAMSGVLLSAVSEPVAARVADHVPLANSPSAQPLAATLPILYSARQGGGREIYRTDANGNTVKKVISLNQKDGYPAASPDGKALAFYSKYDGNKTWSIHTAKLDGSGVKRLTRVSHKWDSAPAWSPDGKQIAFGREYKNAKGQWQEEIWLMNADGSEQRQLRGLDGGAPEYFPDGRLVFHSKTGTSEIVVANGDGSHPVALTHNEAEDWHPAVSPDGKSIAFMSDRDGNREIYLMNSDGTGQRRLTHNDVDDWTPTWSADGTQILFASSNDDDFFDVFVVNKDGSGLKRLIKNATQASWMR